MNRIAWPVPLLFLRVRHSYLVIVSRSDIGRDRVIKNSRIRSVICDMRSSNGRASRPSDLHDISYAVTGPLDADPLPAVELFTSIG